MKSIFEYKSYRQYMQDYYEDRKMHGSFSWREFCRLAGFSSPNFLKLVSIGRSNLSKIKISAVAKAMGLVGFEEEYFKQMVLLEISDGDDAKKAALEEMNRIAQEQRVRVVDSDAFQYYESWKYPVLRELAPMMPGATPRDLADACKEYVSAEEVSDILKFLVNAGFLKKDGEKRFLQTEKTVVGSNKVMPIAIRSMHREMAKMAVRAVDRYTSTERYLTGITFSANAAAYDRIIDEVECCCKRVLSIVNEYEKTNQVFRINFQIFPCTDKIKEGGRA